MTTKKSPTKNGMKMLPKKSTKHAIKIQHVLSFFQTINHSKFVEVLVNQRKALNHCKEGAHEIIGKNVHPNSAV